MDDRIKSASPSRHGRHPGCAPSGSGSRPWRWLRGWPSRRRSQRRLPRPPHPSRTCRTDLIAWATAHDVPQAVAQAQLGGLEPDPDVLAATQNQGEFVRPIWDYIDASVTPARIEAGQRKLAALAGPLAAIETQYGVDRYTLVAFWGVESTYGTVLDNPGVVKPVVRSLATLSCGDPTRAAYGATS